MRDSTYFRQFRIPLGYVRSYQAIGTADHVDWMPNGVRLVSGSSIVEAVALAPGVFRIGLFCEGRPPVYESVAVVPRIWPAHPVELAERDGLLRIATGALGIRVGI